MLIGLEGDVVRTLQSIKKGIQLLDERRALLREPDEDAGAEEYPEDEPEPSPGRARG